MRALIQIFDKRTRYCLRSLARSPRPLDDSERRSFPGGSAWLTELPGCRRECLAERGSDQGSAARSERGQRPVGRDSNQAKKKNRGVVCNFIPGPPDHRGRESGSLRKDLNHSSRNARRDYRCGVTKRRRRGRTLSSEVSPHRLDSGQLPYLFLDDTPGKRTTMASSAQIEAKCRNAQRLPLAAGAMGRIPHPAGPRSNEKTSGQSGSGPIPRSTTAKKARTKPIWYRRKALMHNGLNQKKPIWMSANEANPRRVGRWSAIRADKISIGSWRVRPTTRRESRLTRTRTRQLKHARAMPQTEPWIASRSPPQKRRRSNLSIDAKHLFTRVKSEKHGPQGRERSQFSAI